MGAFVVPIGRMARILVFGTRKGQMSRMLPAAPWVLGLLYSQAAGQLIGYAFGAGDRARNVQ